MPTATKQTLIVSKDELAELAEWERKHDEAKKKVSAAEKELKFRRISLAEKVLGVKSEDEFKKLSPKDVEKRYAARLTAGDWKPERGAPGFVFLEKSKGRYPAWKEIFIGELGETAAAKITADTDLTYSYAVQVAAQ
ncbi:MAG TPA: hypothetical protein VGG46_04145 [Terriglobales bacterium]